MKIEERDKNEVNEYFYRGVAKVGLIGEDGEIQASSYYSQSHWAKATIETLVKLGNLEEPVVALVDHGLEINL